MDKIALIVWSIVIGLAAVAVKHTEIAWSVGVLAMAVCIFITIIYTGVTK